MTDKGAVRRIRNQIIRRGNQIESIRPKTAENKAYIRGLEYALAAVDAEFGEVI